MKPFYTKSATPGWIFRLLVIEDMLPGLNESGPKTAQTVQASQSG